MGIYYDEAQKSLQKRYIGGNITDMQGPCPSGFHVPTNSEITTLKDTLTTLGISTSDGNGFKNYLKMPFSGIRYYDGGIGAQGTNGYYWTSTPKTENQYAYVLIITSSQFLETAINRCNGEVIRPFKDTAIIPDSGWTRLYAGTGDAGIFHDTTNGYISLSSDGINRITIADKNLGATQVYNDGDTLSEANCGKYFQWGNNYGFSFTGAVTTSNTQVDASNYGPGNYYSSSTFILQTTAPYDRSSVQNDNLRGGVLVKEVSKVYVGDPEDNTNYIQIRPNLPKTRIIDFLLIGGGGGGGGMLSGGGGAGGVVQCCDYEIASGEYSVTIGTGGNGWYGDYIGNNGGNSIFNNLTAYGGGGGGGRNTVGNNGGSGGGGGTHNSGGSMGGGQGCSGQGYNGGGGYFFAGGGGGGAGGVGCSAASYICGGMGGPGIQSDISGTNQWYAGGGSGFDTYGGCEIPANCGGTNSGYYNKATICGAGGGGAYYGYCCGQGGNGLFILRYPTACGYDVTGGTKYTCGNYTIHCFTSDGTLTIN